MEPYLGEIRMFAGNFAPQGWAFCDGQQLSISQNEALYSLIGTNYGGDGMTTFGLPDLRGRVPLHTGPGHPLGEMAGSENIVVTLFQLPAHTHAAQGNKTASQQQSPQESVWGFSEENSYVKGAANGVMNASAIGAVGENTPHDNMMPFRAVSFIMAMEGVWPNPQ